MHELGTVIYVMDQVEKIAAENNLTTVSSITLQVGEVSSIIPSYLADFWLFARKRHEFFINTELIIEKLEAVTFCQNCGKTYPTIKYKKICPYCKSDNTFLVTGNEYIIKEIEAM